ncbi:MAG: helix-turn-helix domain-containing protein [Pseudomonadales bacterium]
MTSAATPGTNSSFSDLLRNWRKIRKFSQLKLLLDANVSQRHLSFLESGKAAPSRDMVISLSSTLDLPLREQNALLNAAGFANIFSENKMDHAEMKLANQALKIMLDHHEPYGAIVIDQNWNIQMLNEASTRIFSLFVDPVNVWNDMGGAPPNAVRLTLHPRGLKPYLVNWIDFANYFQHQLTRELASNPYNRGARELLDEIQEYPGLSDPRFPSTDTPKPYLSMTLKKGDIELQFFTMVSTFGTPQDVTLQEIRIETLFPADDKTEQFVRALS